MTTATLPQPFTIAEPIAGYHTTERLGAGGYGEVWRAEAPGGIAKAVKVVYGYENEDRAMRELSALNRIKEVRHPFVLSLERIELVDGHLVIVTELAASNMKRVFDERRRSGLPGIPREELLNYLHDAADALDYIYQEHSLQHLDVKPENLLLVGGRIKVGDFGLVKDLQDVNCSNISGLTPVYAAPELFDGRPNNHSDQYSLAIVYEEMLTGALPYEGRTTAQLAAQHLHGRPRLDPLPAGDRPTIARALSKDPERRFASCREMVESLQRLTPSSLPEAAHEVGPMDGPCAPASAPAKTEVLSWNALEAAATAARAVAGTVTQRSEPAPPVRDLPPLDIRPGEVEHRPTVFVGIGGFAAKVFQSLHQQLADRFKDLHSAPALQLLLFDTDAKTLETVTEANDQWSLDNDSAVLLPLRQPAEYRRGSGKRMQWLSRRWIYNVPRSLQTQGLRPLGRLAMVDHCERVQEKLNRAIEAAVDTEGLAATARETGLPFRAGQPRIFVVASTSGGTGGGMALDMGYLIRKALTDLGLSPDGICGILAHCSGHNQEGRDLAMANSYALLEELCHYSDWQWGYPGDPDCSLPAFPPNTPPFSHTYVANLGEDLDADGIAAAADVVAKYLYCNAVTPAGTFFDKSRCQQADDLPAADQPAVGTFGLCQLGFCRADVPAAAVEELCQALVMRWRGSDRVEPEEESASLSDPGALLMTRLAVHDAAEDFRAEVASHMEALGLNIQRIIDHLNEVAARQMGADPESYLLVVLEKLVKSYESGGTFSHQMPPGRWILDALDGLIRSQGAGDAHRVCLESVLEEHWKETAIGQAVALNQWLLGLVASPQYRVTGAQRMTDCAVEYLRTLSQQANELIQTLRLEISTLEEAMLADQGGSCQWLRFRGLGARRRLVADPRVLQYFQLRIRESMLNGVCRITGIVLSRPAALADKLRNLATDFNALAKTFNGLPAIAGPQTAATTRMEGMRRVVAEMTRLHKAELVAEMERLLEKDLQRTLADDENNVRRVLSHLLRRMSLATILRALKTFTQQEIEASKGAPGETVFSVGVGLKAAMPQLRDCGGARRFLLAAPASLSPLQLADQLAAKLQQRPTVVANVEDDVLLCCEMQQLSLRRVAGALLDGRFQNVEVASRLHTRIDVPWSPL